MNKIILTISLAMLTSPVIAAKKQDYKCYLETSQGFEIGFYAWQSDKLDLNIAKLVGRPSNKLNKKGVLGYVKSVEECVTSEEEFTNAQAKALDSKTLR